MEKLQDLEKKVNRLEYTELKDVKEKINNIEVGLAKNTQLTESLITTNKDLGNTLRSVEKTMIAMSESMKQSSDKVDGLSNKVDKMGERINEIDDKDKIDTSKIFNKTVASGIEKVLIFIIGGSFVAFVASLI